MQKIQRKTGRKSYWNVTFQQSVNTELVQSKQIKQQLDKHCWCIDTNDYYKFNWKEVFSKILQCSVNIIFLCDIKNPQIIKQIQNVQYKYLITLSLESNNIDNIEGLSMIKFSSLEFLILSWNRINRITSFHKLSTPCIRRLNLRKNPLNQVKFLQTLSFKKNGPIKIELERHFEQCVVCYDLNILTKICLMLSESVEITAESDKRIKQPKVKQIIQNGSKARFTTY